MKLKTFTGAVINSVLKLAMCRSLYVARTMCDCIGCWDVESF